MAYKVSAHITAYEDQEAVVECLKAIANLFYSIQKIIMFDNLTENYLKLLNFRIVLNIQY